MLKQFVWAVALGLLFAGGAPAAEAGKRQSKVADDKVIRLAPKHPPVGQDVARARASEKERGNSHGRGRDWDRDRDSDRDHDRRDDDWERRGWHYAGWRDDGWRHYRWHDNRHWRYVPPYRYSLDFGYRSGYELAWRDWLSYGRYDRYWRRSAFHGFGAYRAGYEAGWRDAAFYYGRGYRPDYWGYDPHGGWYFSFSIVG